MCGTGWGEGLEEEGGGRSGGRFGQRRPWATCHSRSALFTSLCLVFFFLRAIVSHTTRGGSSVVARPTTPFVSILPFRPQVSLGSPFAASLSVCFRFNLSNYTVGCKYQNAYMLRLFQHIHRFYSIFILRYKAHRVRMNFRIYDKIIKKIQRVESIQFMLTPRNVQILVTSCVCLHLRTSDKEAIFVEIKWYKIWLKFFNVSHAKTTTSLFSYRRFICLEANILLCKVLWAVDQLLFSFPLIYDGCGSSQKIIYFSETRVS